MDRLYRYFIWIVVGVSIIAYLAYRTISFEGSIEQVISSPDTWLNIAFVVWLNLNVLQGAIDAGISYGLDTEEFILADKANNSIIQSVNNEMVDFRKYIKLLNYNEKIRLEEDLLFKYGVDTYEELNHKQKRAFKRLKPIRHNIYGFNLPLFYELTKNGEIKYQASYQKNKGLYRKRLGKIMAGILFGAISINIAFNASGITEALISMVIISSGLIITFLMAYMPPVFKLMKEIPKAVILKSTLYSGYINFKQGTHELKIINVEQTLAKDKKIVVEPPKSVVEPIVEIKEPLE